jgi:hypothetical protein
MPCSVVSLERATVSLVRRTRSCRIPSALSHIAVDDNASHTLSSPQTTNVWLSEAQRGCQARLSEGDPPTRCARSTARHPPRLRGCVAVRNALPRLAHGRSRLCHPGPTRRRLRAAAPTAESGRVARSSGPHGPLHRRPWLRHRAHRRGHASAASRPRKAHARVVAKVCLSAQRSADRSVQPRSHGHGAAALPPPCAGLPGDVLAPHRLGNALERTLRLASPRCPQGA